MAMACPSRTRMFLGLQSPCTRLTRRERQVLTLLASGRSNREIAATLRLSVNTVAAHRASLKRTLAIRQVAALVQVAVRHGLVAAEQARAE